MTSDFRTHLQTDIRSIKTDKCWITETKRRITNTYTRMSRMMEPMDMQAWVLSIQSTERWRI